MHQIKTQLSEFSAAHRLIKDYVGKCRSLHGHNYRAFLTFSTDTLDHNGFVTDFSEVKKVCNSWVDDHWDHAILICSEDTPLLEFAQQNDQKHYIFPNGDNTTVEVLSHHLFQTLNPMVETTLSRLNPGLMLTEVEIWETHSACARFCP